MVRSLGPGPNQPQRRLLPESRVILEAFRAGVGFGLRSRLYGT